MVIPIDISRATSSNKQRSVPHLSKLECTCRIVRNESKTSSLIVSTLIQTDPRNEPWEGYSQTV